MANVPDHLVPADGLTNSFIRYAGFDAAHGSGAATHRFDIHDQAGRCLATYQIATAPTPDGTVDAMIAEAHRQLVDVLRQWLFEADSMRKAYERSGAR